MLMGCSEHTYCLGCQFWHSEQLLLSITEAKRLLSLTMKSMFNLVSVAWPCGFFGLSVTTSAPPASTNSQILRFWLVSTIFRVCLSAQHNSFVLSRLIVIMAAVDEISGLFCLVHINLPTDVPNVKISDAYPNPKAPFGHSGLGNPASSPFKTSGDGALYEHRTLENSLR